MGLIAKHPDYQFCITGHYEAAPLRSEGRSRQGTAFTNLGILLKDFPAMQVSMPTTSSKVPGAVKEVEERKAYWLKKRAEAKEKGFVADEEAASSSSKPKQQPNGIAKGRGPNPTLDLTTEEWPGELF